MEYDNNNKVGFGKLEKNPDKTPEDTKNKPDLKGWVNMQEKFYNAAAWFKKDDNGKPCYQLTIERQQKKKEPNNNDGKPF